MNRILIGAAAALLLVTGPVFAVDMEFPAATPPIGFMIGNATFTPGGFLDMAGVYRSRDVGSGLPTTFGTIPFANTTAGRLSESRLSAQNSRLSLEADDTIAGSTMSAYVEGDFLGSQPGNAYVTSNSQTFRLRQYWADWQSGDGRWEMIAGQAWSLLTPNRTGIDSVPQDIFLTYNEDANYQAGLTWARQAQLRGMYFPRSDTAIALSLENPEQYVGTNEVAYPTALAPSLAGQYDNGSNTATPNLMPDVILKAAYDPGDYLHLEAAGLMRVFRDYDPVTGRTESAVGGGGSLNLNWLLCRPHNLRLILNTFYSRGGGRYIDGLGPDVVVTPDGKPKPVGAYSTVDGVEFSVFGDTVAAYYGGAYFQRESLLDTTAGGPGAAYAGFGYPGSANTANRFVQEVTVDWLHKLWVGDGFNGSLYWILQYSYVERAPWYAATGTPSLASASMVYASLRYNLP